MERSKAQQERALLRAEKQGYQVETYKKVEHTNSATLDNKKVAQFLGGDEDSIKVTVMSHDLRIAIGQARNEKGLNQEQFANLISEQKSNVRDYESGKMVPSGNVIVKMEKALGVKLPRPIKKKVGES